MNTRSNIWSRLRDHQIPPPPEVLDDLRKILHLSDETETTQFKKLQDHSLPPPAFLRSAITSAVTSATTQPKPNKIKRLLPYAAAACLLLVVVGIIVDRASRSHRNDPRTIAGTAANRGGQTAAASHTDTTTKATGPVTPGPANATDSSLLALTTGLNAPLTLTIDGTRFSLVDNNPLVTFISYKYPALKNHLENKRDANLRIRLDQYTNITLSPVMTGMIRDLFDTRSNGTPSRRSRKTKERLEKWKTTDEKYFDEARFSNPLDPIDLAEFIFPPLFAFGHPAPAATQAEAIPKPAARPATPDDLTHDDDLTISYALSIVSKRKNTGIGETYNGGIETFFRHGSSERLRLASLMRIQSIVYSGDSGNISLFTESAKKKTKTALAWRQWAASNQKYVGAAYNLTADTTLVLGYSCKKALISLKDGRQITAWYTPRIGKPAHALIPAFSGVPGLVLRYDYTCRKKTLRYTATSISRKPIDPSVFRIAATP